MAAAVGFETSSTKSVTSLLSRAIQITSKLLTAINIRQNSNSTTNSHNQQNSNNDNSFANSDDATRIHPYLNDISSINQRNNANSDIHSSSLLFNDLGRSNFNDYERIDIQSELSDEIIELLSLLTSSLRAADDQNHRCDSLKK